MKSCLTCVLHRGGLLCAGGAITVDETRNTECYGAGTTVEDILSGRIERPSHMLPLYKRIADIIQGRAGHN